MNPDDTEVPWFFETTQPNLFNEWTWTHFFWGILSNRFIDSNISALAIHTLYEFTEGFIFPSDARDTSNLNHIGDTIAFMAGRLTK